MEGLAWLHFLLVQQSILLSFDSLFWFYVPQRAKGQSQHPADERNKNGQQLNEDFVGSESGVHITYKV